MEFQNRTSILHLDGSEFNSDAGYINSLDHWSGL